jgi:hypothetical protein
MKDEELKFEEIEVSHEKSLDFISVWSILFRLNVLKEGYIHQSRGGRQNMPDTVLITDVTGLCANVSEEWGNGRVWTHKHYLCCHTHLDTWLL